MLWLDTFSLDLTELPDVDSEERLFKGSVATQEGIASAAIRQPNNDKMLFCVFLDFIVSLKKGSGYINTITL